MLNLETPSLVHTQETTVHFSPEPTYRAYARSPFLPALNLLAETLLKNGDGQHLRWLDKVDNCRTKAYFIQNRISGEIRVASSRCKFRWCPMCSAAHAAYASRSVRAWIGSKPYPKFVTLTLQHTDRDLRDQVDHIYESFRELRRIKQFKEAIHGGVWFFQITYNRKTKTWHPHIHLICYGDYLSRKILSAHWDRITGGSVVVDIRAIKDSKVAARHAARYISTPTNPKKLSCDLFEQAIDQLYHRRLCGTWGKRPLPKLRPPRFTDKDSWHYIGKWSTVTAMARYDPDAQEVLNLWQKGNLSTKLYCFGDVENFIDGTDLEDPPCESMNSRSPPPAETAELFGKP